MRDFRPRSRSALSMRIIAILIRSAAVPCSGVLTAVRSANPRWFAFLLLMSGIGRTRPNRVFTFRSRRASSSVLSMNARTPLYFSKYALMNCLASLGSVPKFLRESKRREPIHNAEIHHLRLATVIGRDHQRRNSKHLRSGQRMDVVPAAVSLDQQRIARKVRQQAQFDL